MRDERGLDSKMHEAEAEWLDYFMFIYNSEL